MTEILGYAFAVAVVLNVLLIAAVLIVIKENDHDA